MLDTTLHRLEEWIANTNKENNPTNGPLKMKLTPGSNSTGNHTI